jgi:hypothetical protein
MGTPDDGAPLAHATEQPTESPRYGSTLSGCLGLICVLALPVLLFLPLDGFVPAPWFGRLLSLAGVAISAVGVWLVARVPAATSRRAVDPLRPLTSEGHVPLREVPASRGNRIGLAAAVALTALCGAGVVLVVFAPHARDVLSGTLLCAGGGCASAVYAILAARGTLPAPALRWLRQPIRGGYPPVWFLLVGGVSLVWALIIAFEAGYAWAAAATTLVILLGLLAGPAGQRLPPRVHR